MMRRGRTLVEWLVMIAVVGVLCTLLMPFGLAFAFEFVFYIALGWILYLRRVAGEISVDWPTVTLSCVALLAFGIGLHYFLQWFARARKTDQVSDETPSQTEIETLWKGRWTISIVAVVVMMFVAGICVTGITHQLAWWARSSTPTLVSSSNVRYHVQSQNNSKQIGLGSHGYAEEHGTLPPGGTMSSNGKMKHGWLTFLLPYVDEQDLSEQIDFDHPWDHANNKEAFQSEVYTYQGRWANRNGEPEASEEGYWLTDYAANVHVIGGTRKMSLNDITDGESNTILSGEAFSQRKPWGHPANWRDPNLGINKSPKGFGGPWGGGTNFTFADGSARFINEDIDPEVLRALSTPDGGESMAEEAW